MDTQTTVTAPQLHPVYASINDFCRLSGLGRTTVYAALRDGHLTARKLGAKTLIPVAAGLAWVEALPAYRPAKGTVQ